MTGEARISRGNGGAIPEGKSQWITFEADSALRDKFPLVIRMAVKFARLPWSADSVKRLWELNPLHTADELAALIERGDKATWDKLIEVEKEDGV